MNAPARKTLHLARPDDAVSLARMAWGAPLDIQRLEGEGDEHYAKRCAAIRALGEKWLRHPNYKFDPLHSVHSDVWRPAHLAFWARVHVDAMKAREANPAFKRAQAVRAAVGEQ